MASGLTSLNWQDDIGHGVIGKLNLEPLRDILVHNNVLVSSSRILELLTGQYVRNGNYVQLLRMKHAANPRYVKDCDLAIVLGWETTAPAAIDAKARDVFSKLVEANEQLPIDRPGVVHIGFEAVDGDAVERLRYAKILESVRRFDPRGKPLEYVYCHYFVPESPPDEAWAFDETTQWCGVRPTGPHTLGKVFLVLPETADTRHGPHWQG